MLPQCCPSLILQCFPSRTLPYSPDADDVCTTSNFALGESSVQRELMNTSFSCHADNQSFPGFCIDCVGLLSTDELPCAETTTK